MCCYEVDIITKGYDKTVFKGKTVFTVQPKEAFYYELMFTPNAEDLYEVSDLLSIIMNLSLTNLIEIIKAELRFNNVTEAIQNKYFLSGQGERRPPLGEVKLETRVGQR